MSVSHCPQRVDLFSITLLEPEICGIMAVLFAAKLDFFVVFKLLFHERKMFMLREMDTLDLAPPTKPHACLITWVTCPANLHQESVHAIMTPCWGVQKSLMKGSREDSARERPNRMQGLVLQTAWDLIDLASVRIRNGWCCLWCRCEIEING